MGEHEVRFFENLRDRGWYVFDTTHMSRNLKCPYCDSGYSIEIGFKYEDGLPCLCNICKHTWKVYV